MTNPRTDHQTAIDDHYVFDHYPIRRIIGSPIEEMTYIDHRHPHYHHTHTH